MAVSKNRFIFTVRDGSLYLFDESKVIRSDYSLVYKLRTSSIANRYGFWSLTTRKLHSDGKTFDEDLELYPSFGSYFLFNPKERKLMATGVNEGQLGVGKKSFNTLCEVKGSVDDALKLHDTWSVIDIATGCDFSMLLVGESPQGRSITRMRQVLFQSSNMLTDLTIYLK